MSADTEQQKSQETEPQPESMCDKEKEPALVAVESVDDKEARKAAFKEFIKSLPRTCSPTICGTVGCPSPGFSKVDADCSEEWHTQEFNWSIDQIAILNPCEISLDEQFNGELTNLVDSSLSRENDEFFKQLEILPSPACRVIRTPGDGQATFLTPFTRVPPGNRSTPYQPCTPPPTRSASRTARLSSNLSSTPYGYNKTKNKKKLFNDNNQDDIPEDSESNGNQTAPMFSIDRSTSPFSISLISSP